MAASSFRLFLVVVFFLVAGCSAQFSLNLGIPGYGGYQYPSYGYNNGYGGYGGRPGYGGYGNSGYGNSGYGGYGNSGYGGYGNSGYGNSGYGNSGYGGPYGGYGYYR